MNKNLVITLLIFLSVFYSCNVNVAKHNYLDASDVTKEYIVKLFVQNDYTTAYNMMADELKAKVNKDQLKKLSIETHANSFPKEFEINEFETYSGQELISIFAVTKNYSPKLFYRVTLLGTSQKGYAIAGFHAANKPIPAQGNRIPINPSIAF